MFIPSSIIDHPVTCRSHTTACLSPSPSRPLTPCARARQVRANIHMMLANCCVPRDHRPLTTEFAGGAALARSPERAVATDSPWSQQPMHRRWYASICWHTSAAAADRRRRDARERTERALEHVPAALDCLRRREELNGTTRRPRWRTRRKRS